jgi:hypothetical protein
MTTARITFPDSIQHWTQYHKTVEYKTKESKGRKRFARQNLFEVDYIAWSQRQNTFNESNFVWKCQHFHPKSGWPDVLWKNRPMTTKRAQTVAQPILSAKISPKWRNYSKSGHTSTKVFCLWGQANSSPSRQHVQIIFFLQYYSFVFSPWWMFDCSAMPLKLILSPLCCRC